MDSKMHEMSHALLRGNDDIFSLYLDCVLPFVGRLLRLQNHLLDVSLVGFDTRMGKVLLYLNIIRLLRLLSSSMANGHAPSLKPQICASDPS